MAIEDLDDQFQRIDHVLWAEALSDTIGNQRLTYNCSDDDARNVLRDIAASKLIADIIYKKHMLWHEGIRIADDAYVETEQEREDKIRFPFVNLHPRHKPVTQEALVEKLTHYNYGLILAGTALRILTSTDISGVVPKPEIVLDELINMPLDTVTAATHSTVERSRSAMGKGMPYTNRPYPAIHHITWKINTMDPQSFTQTGEIHGNTYRQSEAAASLFFWSLRSVIDGAQFENIVGAQ